MSLIDEALKRAEMEAARRDGLKGGAYPWVLEQHTKPRRPWRIVAAALIAAGIAAGAVLWLSRRPVHPTAPATVQSPVSGVQSSPPKEELPTVEVAPPPRGFPSRVVAGDGETATPKVGVEPRQPTPKPPADAPRDRPAPSAEPRPAPVAIDTKTYVGEVTAPDGAKIELGGIVYSETNPVALINGKVLGPGATVEEFTIVSIQPDRVELRGRGLTMFLALK